MLLEFNNVSKSYDIRGIHKNIICNVTFTLERGKSVGILGRNGQGKSTLVKLISGLEKPTRGIIRRNGRFSWPMGFSGGFNGSMTGEENLRFICRIYGADIKKVRTYVDEFAELGSDMRVPVKTYSSGMKAKLAFGLSMAIDFDCYLIDEVMGVGDAHFQRKAKKFFQDKKKEADLIIVSHNMNHIKEYCDTVAVLRSGEINFYEDIEEAIDIYEK
jgi:capsular polysaccharide transport system ATP-binding protein